jgi:hypothetical protein
MMRFISPVGPMWLSTMRTIEKQLVEDTLVRRYEVERTHVDGLPHGEGSFTACSFGFVECLARAGKSDKAQLLLEKLWGYANHLWIIFRAAWRKWTTSRQFSASIHTSGSDQCRDLPEQDSLGKARRCMALDA